MTPEPDAVILEAYGFSSVLWAVFGVLAVKG
jgi:hypothetical protein